MTKITPKYKAYKYILPEGVPEILENYCTTNSLYQKPQIEYFKYAYILDIITRDTATYLSQGKRYYDYKGHAIHMDTLATIIGTRHGTVSELINNLISWNIIRRVGSYSNGVSSYHYILSEIPEAYTSITALPEYTKIPEKIITRRNLFYASTSHKLKLYKRYIQKITIDILDNINYTESGMKEYISDNTIQEEYSYNSNISNTTHNTPMMVLFHEEALKHSVVKVLGVSEKITFTSKYVNIERAININLLLVRAIIEGNWYVHRINNKSRVYTNLTNLKREFRRHLKYDGKSLIELDIRNSQPLIAAIVIREYFIKKNLAIPLDVIQYQKDCEAGEFYDYFMSMNDIGDEARNDFKVQLFAEVFFSKVSKRKTALKSQLIEKYPSVYEAICCIKGGLGSKSYNKFAILLQCKEADIIFDDVNIGLLKDNIPAFNIFDSILCLGEHREIVRQRLVEAFGKHGLSPTINYKNYSEDSV